MNAHHDRAQDNSITVKHTLLFMATAGSFLTPFMISSINIALPAIQREFAADAVVLSWIATSFLLSSAVFLLPIGKLADILGRMRLYKWGMISFTTFTLASGFVPNIELLIVMRILQGISASIIATAGMALITSAFPPQERGKALGLNVSAVYIGLAAGPFLGGFITEHWGWRSIFLVLVPLGVLITVLTIINVKSDWADASNDKLDIPGSLIYAVTLIAFIYGSSILPDILGIILILFSIVSSVFFVKRQLKVPNPVLEIRLFRNNRVFAFSNVAALINYGASYSVTFLLSLYLQYIQGMSSEHAGIILIIQPIIQSLISPIAGRISDKKEPAKIASLGMAGTAAGLFLLSFIGPHTSLFLIIAALIFLGLGFALFSSPNTNAVMSSVDKCYYGVASASVSMMRVLGQMLSMATATLLISMFVGKNQITPEYYSQFIHSIHLAFLISACLCAVGIFFSYARGEIHVNNQA